jgi:PKD repeat protein
MKKITLLISLLLLVAFGVNAQQFSYTGSWGKAGFNLVDSKTTGVQVIYSVPTFSLEDMVVNGQTVKNIMLPGNFLFNDAGMPNLPGQGTYIAVPQGATPKLKIISQRTEVIHNVDIVPAPVIPAENDDSPLNYTKSAVYSQNALFPANPVQISGLEQIRGVDVVMLGITPFQYNPVTKDLIVFTDIKLEIELEGGNGQIGDNAYRNRFWDPILKDALLNNTSLPVINYDQRFLTYTDGQKDTECEYIIISPDGPEFLAWADSLANWRNQEGILTHVFSLTEVGGNTTTAIEAFVNNAYNTWTIKPAAVLLLGDYGSNQASNVISPLKTLKGETFPSDHVYADVDNDDMAEIVFARIVANNETQLTTICSKQLDYERNPPTDTGYYQHPITALGWQTERWFQICSEAVGGYFKYARGRFPVRINEIYQGTPGSVWSSATNTTTVVNYFGPNGLGYIPQSPSSMPCCWNGGNASQINAAIDNGAFMLQHRDHGMETGWGEPAYSNNNITPLNNTKLTFVMSINCLTGKYNWGSECFAEKFIRHTKNNHNAGALGLVCPSEVSYSFVNDTFVWGMYDNMWPDFMPNENTEPESRGVLPAFGMCAGKYFLKQSSWPYNSGDKQITYYLFHMHGDAFLRLFDTVPQSLTVSHDPDIEYGATSFAVTANTDAMIALTVDNEIIATGIGLGSTPTVMTIPVLPVGTEVLVTVSMQSHLRYRSVVPVTTLTLVANFSASMTSICVGSTVDFTDMSSGEPDAWSWEFAGGTPATANVQNPTSITYTEAGDYDVTLTINKTGVDPSTTVKSAYIHVYNLPEAFFDVEASCAGQPTQFLDRSHPNGGTISQWEWTFEPGATSMQPNPTYTFANAGTYPVTLKITTNGICQAEITQDVVIVGLPGFAAKPEGEVDICQDLTGIEFTTTGATDATAYVWIVEPEEAGTISGSTTTGSLNLNAGYTGAITVKVEGVNVCGEGGFSELLDVIVHPNPSVPVVPEGADSVNLNLIGATDFTTTETPDVTSYMWAMTPETAGTIAGTGLTGTATWNREYRGIVKVTVRGVSMCGESLPSEEKEVTLYAPVGISEINGLGIGIYPNPTHGKFSLDVVTGSSMTVSISIYNALGTVVYSADNIRINGKLHRNLDLSAQPKGVYHLKVEGNDASAVQRVVIE